MRSLTDRRSKRRHDSANSQSYDRLINAAILHGLEGVETGVIRWRWTTWKKRPEVRKSSVISDVKRTQWTVCLCGSGAVWAGCEGRRVICPRRGVGTVTHLTSWRTFIATDLRDADNDSAGMPSKAWCFSDPLVHLFCPRGRMTWFWGDTWYLLK